MTTVGERLKVERESHKTTLEEMVVATGIGQTYLDALERDAIHELPGKAFGKLYIRAYAEVFGFDPQSWIDDYDREQRSVQGASTEPTPLAPVGSRPVAEAIARWKAARADADKAEPAVEAIVPDTEPAPEPEPEPETAPEGLDVRPTVIPQISAEVVIPEAQVRVPTAKRFVAPLLVLGTIAIAIAVYFGERGAGPTEGAASRSVSPTSVPPAPVEPTPELRPQAPPPVIAEPQALPPTSAPIAGTAVVPGELTVTEFGVGRRIVNLRLEGENDRFAPGDRVCFASRVVGGQRGDVIRHVWLYEGRTQQTITLRLGGRDFRTHSNKTLGHAGSWAVEARDGTGGVLARVTFTCLPPER